MEASKKLPEKLQDALRRDVLKRLPLTFLPFVNQQLHEWEFLFPNEKESTERLIVYVDSLSPREAAALFSDVVSLEDKMGASRWQQFSTEKQTIENSSELARSPHFQEWRQAVQVVFDAASRYAMKAHDGPVKPRNRAIVLDIPASLPVEQPEVWRHWHELGRRVKLQTPASQSSHGGLDGMLSDLIAEATKAGESSNSDLISAANSSADSWVIDGGRSLVDACLTDRSSASTARAILLSYARLDACRESFSREINTMHKNLSDADSVFDHLRKVDVAPWCPPEVAAEPAVREFVRSLYLSGNGAVIFGNSFVEWAASEALRRARPRFLAARFSVRNKPKPFTSVAVFEDPDQVNPLPAVDDFTGSAVDAEILAAYIWLSAIRYEEYRQSTVCICVAWSLAEAYLVAPPEFILTKATEPIPVESLAESLRLWLS
jgi:hypothetical protein